MFELGQVVITRGIQSALDDNLFTRKDLLNCLILHNKNISESCEEDKNYNLEDIKNNCGRVLNKYTLKEKYTIFINTYLGDYKETTIMFTHEY